MNILKKLNLLSIKRSKRIVALTLMLSLGVSSAISVAGLSKTFNIKDGNNVTVVNTLSSDVNEILKRANVVLGKDDGYVVNNKDKDIVDIEIKRAFTVRLHYNGSVESIILNSGTVKELLYNKGIKLDENMTVSPSEDTSLTPDLEVYVLRLLTVNICVDGGTKVIKLVEGSTVSDALKKAEVNISSDDEVNEPLDKIIEDGLSVVVNRVEWKNETEKQIIPFSIVTKNTPTLAKGASKVETPGENGEKEIQKKVKYINGTAVESEVTSEKVLKNAVNRINLVGTKQRKSGNWSIDEKAGTIRDDSGNVHNYKSIMTGVCTAYCSSDGARTSTGAKPRRGIVAVDPKKIPYGTKMYIPGYGVCVAGDTGGAMRLGHALIDVYMDSEQECRNWGRQTKKVYILG